MVCARAHDSFRQRKRAHVHGNLFRMGLIGRALLLLSATACGRVDFDPTFGSTGDARDDDAPSADAQPSGLLLHFPFEADGLLRDHAAGHHDAACATTCPVSAPGRVGAAAASFSGGACLEIADATELHPAAFTYAVWYRPDISSLATAFGRPLNGATAGTNTFEAFSDPTDVWKVAVNTMSVNVPLDHGVWHHLAGAFDGDTLTMYVDGVAQSTPRVVGPASYGPDSLTIGCDVNSGVHSNSATGLVDDVRLYDHALSAAEMMLLVNQQ